MSSYNVTGAGDDGDGGEGNNFGGFGFGIGISVGILLLITTMTLVTYYCTRVLQPAASGSRAMMPAVVPTRADYVVDIVGTSGRLGVTSMNQGSPKYQRSRSETKKMTPEIYVENPNQNTGKVKTTGRRTSLDCFELHKNSPCIPILTPGT